MYIGRLIKGVLAATAALTVASAVAAPSISSWDWRLTSGFTAWRDTLFGAAPGSGGQDQRFMTLSPSGGYQLRDSSGNLVTAYNNIAWGGGTFQTTVGGTGYNAANCRLNAGSTTAATCRGSDPSTASLSINNPTSSPPQIVASPSLGVAGAYQEVGLFRFADANVAGNSAFLDSATYTANLVVRANGDPTSYDALQNLVRSIEIDFTETNNNGDFFGSETVARCAVGTGAVGSCGDIFVIRNTADLIQRIVLDGFEYTFESDFFIGNTKATTLADEVCGQARSNGAAIANGCYGFITGEGVATNISLRTRVTVRNAAVQAPEPTALGLMGLGLVGLAAARKRRR